MKNNKNKSAGITLIALVVTIIVLLILAGISIQMLTGDNGILTRAGDAKKQTDIEGEKEILQISVVSAMGKQKYGDVTKEKLDAELDKNIGNGNYSSNLVDDGIEVTFSNSRRTYIVDSHGNVEKKTPSIEIRDAKVVTNSNGTGEDVTVNSKIEGTDTLYISFKPTIAGGDITSVTYNGNTITSQNGTYVLEISKNGDYNFTINATAEGQTISSPYIKNVDKYEFWGGIEIGDYVTYVPPKNADGTVKCYLLTSGASGYNKGDQSLTQQYNIWRVLNKNSNGTLDLMPAFKDSKVSYTSIGFRDAKGWNNAPYFLDDMCSYLYGNEEKGITARSIDYEDITNQMIEGIEGTTISESTGLKKISKYQSEKVANLSPGTYIVDPIDLSTNTITYQNGRTKYPTSYFNVKDNLSDPYYTSSTIDTDSLSNGRIGTAPKTISIQYTHYTPEYVSGAWIGEIESLDFLNDNVYNIIKVTGASYWIASRCIECRSEVASFSLRYFNGSFGITAHTLFTTLRFCLWRESICIACCYYKL